MPAARMGPSLRVFWRIHRAFMRLTGGRFGRVGAMDALLLTTTGRKSGDRRDVAVNYMRDGDSYVVVASYAGEDRDPAWWLNLKSDPDAEVTLAGKHARVRARDRRRRARPPLVAIYRGRPCVRRIPAPDPVAFPWCCSCRSARARTGERSHADGTFACLVRHLG